MLPVMPGDETIPGTHFDPDERAWVAQWKVRQTDDPVDGPVLCLYYTRLCTYPSHSMVLCTLDRRSEIGCPFVGLNGATCGGKPGRSEPGSY